MNPKGETTDEHSPVAQQVQGKNVLASENKYGGDVAKDLWGKA